MHFRLLCAAKKTEPKKWSLDKEHELRFEVDADSKVTLKVRSRILFAS